MTRADQPVLVTTARQNPQDERRQRQRRYLLTMGIRVLCFVLAIVFAAVHLRWAAGIAVAASLLLPWVAVVVANAGPARREESPSLYAREIEPGE